MIATENNKGAFQAMIWTVLDQFAGRGFSFLVQLILARLLMPSDFAQIAMIFIFIGIGEILSDSGMTASLIRIKNPTEEDYSSVFYLNILIAIFVYAVIYCIAPFISDFYNDPQLAPLVRLYAISIVIKSLSGIQNIILVKQLNFKRQFFIQLPSIIIGGLVGVFCAYRNMGAKAIVYMYITQYSISTIIYWVVEKWIPQFRINFKKLKIHFNFGYKLTIAYVINQIFEDSYNVYIGKFYSPAQLGYYNRANAYTNLPAYILSRSLNKVTYPLFALYNEDDEKLTKLYREITIVVMFVFSFLSAILFFQAENLFKIFLGDRWLAAVVIFKIQVVATLLYPLLSYNSNIIRAKGKSGLILKAMLFYRGLTIAGFIICIGQPLNTLLYWQAFSIIAYILLTGFIVSRQINYTFLSQLKDTLKSVIISFLLALAASVIIYYCKELLPGSLLQLFAFTVLFTLFFWGYNFIVKSEALILFNSLLLKKVFGYLFTRKKQTTLPENLL